MLAASCDVSTMLWALTALRQSVVDDPPDDDEVLFAAIDAVMDPCHAPAPPAATTAASALLGQFPYRRRHGREVALKAAAFSEEDVAWITFQFRRATEPTINRATVRVRPAPTDLIAQARALHQGMSEGDDTVGYLRRYAQALLDLLDLVRGDAA
ncbi:hypothetical protein SLA_7233 [Streptomyces laurentii]|uniref:Uncharacterized protein n=1 Tax=Streptomyces laurentii TaxID=39478 RepID=A0A160P7Z2_STRLU|nr:hypothetical protein SLA_7233 [Streptomyces laurentii]